MTDSSRFTETGEASTASLRKGRTTPKGRRVAPEARERVFERFYRILGNSASGSGLGLAIVREIAQQHGAEIEIFYNPRSTSKKYPGSLFRLTFPPPPAPPDPDAD